jgi:diacylglycerol kinase (ATP)
MEVPFAEVSMLQPDTCVIYNPSSGRGRSARRLSYVRRAWAERAVFWPTSAPGQAEELALQAAHSGFATVAAAGGDGTVHEVANGLLRAERPDVVLAVLPTGSANDYAADLGVDAHWWRRDGAGLRPRAVDVGVVRADGRRRYFVACLGLGFNGLVAQESRRIGWVQGMVLYGLAALHTVFFRYELVPMTIDMDGVQRRVPTLDLSLELGRHEGTYLMAPRAVMDDGWFDYVHAGPLRRRELLPLLPRLLRDLGLPRRYPNLWLGRCRRVRVHSESPLAIHLDGELFCVPEDGVRDVEMDLLPRALRVLGKIE